MTKRSQEPTTQKQIRCAIYTRKSSEEGLSQDFSSLDAQREAAEAFIASQRAEGWQCVPTRYDDGGFTGGNLDRPAVQRLLADIDAGLVDCVVVYKVDRLSRSLIDFARMLETFERHGISFVSVTQQFNTTHSMGRLTLNILLSFAQFEREIISERTRDKIAASKRKGMWGGGRPILGYDIEHLPGGNRLAVNAVEADRVRRIYALYLECGSVSKAIRRMDAMGWKTKAWTTKAGTPQGGRGFDKSQMFHLLTNVAYLGKVRHKDDAFDGMHDAIVDEALFAEVGQMLNANRSGQGRGSGNKHGALLKGLVRCKACGCGMTHHYASDRTKGGVEKRYRYCPPPRNVRANGAWVRWTNSGLPELAFGLALSGGIASPRSCRHNRRVGFATCESGDLRGCLCFASTPLRRGLPPHYFKVGCKQNRPASSRKTPPRDLGGVSAFGVVNSRGCDVRACLCGQRGHHRKVGRCAAEVPRVGRSL